MIHHFHCCWNDAGSNDCTHRCRRITRGIERQQQRSDCRRVRGNPHSDLRGNSEHAFSAHEYSSQVITGGFGIEPTEGDDLTIGEHDFDREDVRIGDAICQAVRAARVVAHVSADRADLLTRRVWCKVIPERSEMFREVEVDDTGLYPCNPRFGVDVNDAVHS